MPVDDFLAVLFFLEEIREAEEKAIEEAREGRGGSKRGMSARAPIANEPPAVRLAELKRLKAEKAAKGATG